MNISLCCLTCKQALDAETRRCLICSRVYPMVRGAVSFVDEEVLAAFLRDQTSDGENAFLAFFKRWPRFYEWMTLIIVPIYYTGLKSKKFLSRFPEGARLLNVGSGATLLHPDIVNVDLVPYEHVHVLANAEQLPFADNTFDAVCTDQVMEHVRFPAVVAAELVRVTKPGGLIYTAAPFMYPYHPSPRDYSRWSVDGLKMLFSGLTVVESGILIGPVSGTLSILASGLAIIFSFGSTLLRKILHYVFMTVLTPLKFLDAIYAHLPGAEEVASNVYVVVQK